MPDVMVPPLLIRLDEEMNILQLGDRLQITATVDLVGLRRLVGILIKYDDILNLMSRARPMLQSDIDDSNSPTTEDDHGRR